MANKQFNFLIFLLGWGMGIFTHHIHSLTANHGTENERFDALMNQPTKVTKVARQQLNNGDTVIKNLDPFPLPPCAPNSTSAVYVLYNIDPRDWEGFSSIKTLLASRFPGRVRLIVDERVHTAIREGKIAKKFQSVLEKIDIHVVPGMPDLRGKELIPHSNKIRALQDGAFVARSVNDECTVVLDGDTYVHRKAPWNQLLSTLQLHDAAVTRDCAVPIQDVPDFLSEWMPNTGVLALRNTPRTRLLLNDWLDAYKPCNGTHVETCTPGTDQYSFLQLTVRHALRLHKLSRAWNCRIERNAIDHAKIEGFPVYSLEVLSNKIFYFLTDEKQEPSKGENEKGASMVSSCGGVEECHVLHGHWLKYPK